MDSSALPTLLQRKDEVGQFARHLHGMIANLQGTLLQIQVMGDQVMTSSQQMQTSGITLTETVQGVSASTQEIARGAETTARVSL